MSTVPLLNSVYPLPLTLPCSSCHSSQQHSAVEINLSCPSLIIVSFNALTLPSPFPLSSLHFISGGLLYLTCMRPRGAPTFATCVHSCISGNARYSPGQPCATNHKCICCLQGCGRDISAAGPLVCNTTRVEKPRDTQEPVTPFIPWISGDGGELSRQTRLHHSRLFL